VHDSVYSRDSIFVYTKGDTVYHEHYNVKYKEYFRNDTINNVYRDSIYKAYPVVKEKIVHKLYWWQKIPMWIGIGSILALIIYVISKFVKVKII
jgi:hypothetical protein